MVFGPAAAIAPSENFVRNANFEPYPRLSESETVGIEPHNLHFNKPSGDSDTLGNTGLEEETEVQG